MFVQIILILIIIVMIMTVIYNIYMEFCKDLFLYEDNTMNESTVRRRECSTPSDYLKKTADSTCL